MKNKIIMLILSAMLLVSLSACNSDMGAFLSGQDNMSDVENKKEDKKTTQLVKVYFSDDQAMNLIEVETEITINKDESLEAKIVETLKSQPKDPRMFNAVGEGIVINSVKVEGKQAKVDLSGKNLNGGSTEETFLIDSIVASLTALDSIDSVKFLVDGKEVETLMGHMETTGSFSRDDLTNSITTIDKIEK